MRIAAVATLCAGCAAQSLYGIETPDAEYWRGYWLDAGEVVSSSREWERKDWLIFGGFLGTSAVIYSQDARIRDAFQDSHTASSEELAEFSERFGTDIFLVPGLVVGYCVASAFDDGRLKEATLLGLESYAVAGALNGGLKFLFGRLRPRRESGPDAFLGPSCLSDPAMPSGHTAVAFAVATSFACEYRNPWVATVAYVLAGLVGWSRIHDDKHWASDVFVGAAVGTLTARGIYRARSRRKAVTSSARARHYYGDLTGYR